MLYKLIDTKIIFVFKYTQLEKSISDDNKKLNDNGGAASS